MEKIEEIKKLKTLLDQGAISMEEFNMLKKNVLEMKEEIFNKKLKENANRIEIPKNDGKNVSIESTNLSTSELKRTENSYETKKQSDINLKSRKGKVFLKYSAIALTLTILLFLSFFLIRNNLIAKENKEYEFAISENSLTALQTYLDKYPQKKHSTEIRNLINKIEQENYWTNAKKIDSKDGYQGYLQKYPNGKHVFEAKNNLSIDTVYDIDGNIYKTVKIGSQLWMTENLRVTKLNDGRYIEGSERLNEYNPGYMWPHEGERIITKRYGLFYNWVAVNTGKLCPIGWHVPSNDDWNTLITFLGGKDVAGGKMKEKGLHTWLEVSDASATNESGFTALGGGRIIGGSGYDGDRQSCDFWSSDAEKKPDYRTRDAYFYSLGLSGDIGFGRDAIYYGLSVRCVKDN